MQFDPPYAGNVLFFHACAPCLHILSTYILFFFFYFWENVQLTLGPTSALSNILYDTVVNNVEQKQKGLDVF